MLHIFQKWKIKTNHQAHRGDEIEYKQKIDPNSNTNG